MAFIPDDALRQSHKLTPAAWTVYQAHCMYRNHKSGVSWGTKERIAAEFHLALGTVRNATTELRQKAWINETSMGVRPLVGDFSPVDKRSASAETERRNIPDLVNPIPESVNQIPDLMNGIPESVKTFHQIGNSHNKERARGSYQLFNQQENQHTHTSTESNAREADESPPDEAPAARVCVSEELTFEDYRNFARGQSSFRAPDAWAMTHFNTGDEPSRQLVREWKERRAPDAILAARAAPVEELMTYGQAMQYLHSFLDAGHAPEKAIDYVRVAPDVRAALVAELCHSPPEHAAGGT